MSKQFKLPTIYNPLINDNINYQILIQQYQRRTYELEQEIETLKRKNLRLGMEMGVSAKKFVDEKTRLQKELEDLTVKYNTLEAVYMDLQKAYEYEVNLHKYNKATSAKDMTDFLGVINIYTNELASVKQQLSDEQNNFSELHKILLFCYSGILKAVNAPSQSAMIEELVKLIPA
jgi:hypothetical protein